MLAFYSVFKVQITTHVTDDVSFILYLLAKNGIYITLVKDVRDAFEGNDLVKIDCEGLNPSDYKKIGAKLRVLFALTNFAVFISLLVVEVNPLHTFFPTHSAKIAYFYICRILFPVFFYHLTMNRY